MNSFSENAKRKLCENSEREYYVYALIDPRYNKVFYIGKGKGDRVFSHEKESDKSPESQIEKLRKIEEIERMGLNVKRIILHYGLTESQAFAAEAALINFLNFAPETKLSNLVAGHGVHEALTVEDFELKFGAERLKIEDIKHNILVIKINRLFNWEKNDEEIYEATRGNWVVSLDRVRNDIEYVFAVYNQLIVGVYKPDEWHRIRDDVDDPRSKIKNSCDDKTKKRVYFICKNYKILDENQKYYLHKSIADFKLNQTAQNPITYLMATVEKKNKVEIVRGALELLSKENKIIYEPAVFPKSDDWIKFQTTELNDLFPFDGLTKWDGERFSSISYLEYHLSSNTIMVTYKKMKKSEDIANIMKQYQEELGLLDCDVKNSYWHLKKYKINYKIVDESEDKVDAMKRQIESCLIQIKEDLNNIRSKRRKYNN